MSPVITNNQISNAPNVNHVSTEGKTEITSQQLLDSMKSILEEGIRQNHSKDYSSERVYQLVQKNLKKAEKMNLPTEYHEIKKWLVEPFYCLQNGSCETKGGQQTDKSRDGEFDLSKTADCLLTNVKETSLAGGICASSFGLPLPAKVIGAAFFCGAIAVKVAACIQDGTEVE